MIRTAFIFENFDHLWMGGRNYYKCLFSAIENYPETVIDPIIFQGLPSKRPYEYFGSIPTRELPILKPRSIPWFFRKILFKIFNKDILLRNSLLRENISLISHQGYIGKNTSIKSVGWIPDFQHKHLKNNFSKKERLNRDLIFKKLCHTSDIILISSESALNDLRQFFPKYANKGRVLNFIGNFPERKPLKLTTIREKYNITEPYFYVPNQFWKHKNHKIILDALKILRHNNVNPVVLCSGSTNDVNNPYHFNLLIKEIKSNNLQLQFRVLGEIDYHDVISLAYHALAIINPSLFEGWSTIVEEARNLNKHQILSNIDVHIEQAPNNSTYIDPNNPEELAMAMMLRLNQKDTVERLEWNELIERYSHRKILFAHQYQNIVQQALAK